LRDLHSFPTRRSSDLYVVLLQTAYDVALNLCNSVLNLGIARGQVREQTVLTNRWVQNTEIKKALNKIKQMGSRHLQIRHGILHRSEEHTSELQSPDHL